MYKINLNHNDHLDQHFSINQNAENWIQSSEKIWDETIKSLWHRALPLKVVANHRGVRTKSRSAVIGGLDVGRVVARNYLTFGRKKAFIKKAYQQQRKILFDLDTLVIESKDEHLKNPPHPLVRSIKKQQPHPKNKNKRADLEGVFEIPLGPIVESLDVTETLSWVGAFNIHKNRLYRQHFGKSNTAYKLLDILKDIQQEYHNVRKKMTEPYKMEALDESDKRFISRSLELFRTSPLHTFNLHKDLDLRSLNLLSYMLDKYKIYNTNPLRTVKSKYRILKPKRPLTGITLTYRNLKNP